MQLIYNPSGYPIAYVDAVGEVKPLNVVTNPQNETTELQRRNIKAYKGEY